MRVFVSWSGKLSKEIGKLLKEWLNENVFADEELEIFLSEDDIDVGEDWHAIIKQELINADCAIVIITKDNIDAPWLNFEAGSIAVSKEDRRAIPFLVNLRANELRTPLSHYQAVSHTKSNLKKLILDLKALGNFSTPSHIDDLIGKFHSKFQKDYKRILSKFEKEYAIDQFELFPANIKAVVKNKVFIGVPMASLEPSQYPGIKQLGLDVKTSLLSHTPASEVYCPCEEIEHVGEFEGYQKAIHVDFQKLKESEHYVFIYPKKIASSILIEVGYAIALSKSTKIFAKSEDDLPFMLKRADKALPNFRIYYYQDEAEILETIEKEGEAFLLG